jgi:cytochrome c peroxidase
VNARNLFLAGALVTAFVAGGLYYHFKRGQAQAVPSEAKPEPKENPHEPKNPPLAAGTGFEWQLPNESWMTPFKDQEPILFVTRQTNQAEWEKLAAFWNPGTEKAVDPKTGEPVERKVVRIKVPLGLNIAPPVPGENPITVAKWKLGKQLYFDHILSSNDTIACASCHDPKRGFTDQSPVSTGIEGQKGGVSAPSVINSAYSALQFWDGRAASLEDQAQGPVQNTVEMTNIGPSIAWNEAVRRVRNKGDYTERFKAVFGTEPTRDAIAKAIAAYERTVLSGNSIHDRAELLMRARVEDEGTGKFEATAKDYAKALKTAFEAKDVVALRALNLDPDKDAGKVEEVAKQINNGRVLFFGKARCNSCHVGENLSDNQFHNLGVGAKEGKLPTDFAGRFGSQPTGHKNPDLYGAAKTPMLRALLDTAPYLHDGSEKTLEAVIDFYDKGGNANEFLDAKMRDYEAEKAWLLAKKNGTEYKGPEAKVYNGKPVVPLKLNLTAEEKKDLVLFLRSLQGDPIPAIVADPAK